MNSYQLPVNIPFKPNFQQQSAIESFTRRASEAPFQNLELLKNQRQSALICVKENGVIWAQLGVIWAHFGVVLDKFGVIWAQYGVVWDYFGIIKTPQNRIFDTINAENTKFSHQIPSNYPPSSLKSQDSSPE